MLTGPMTKRRSNAKTAYDLMTDIRDYILEEPKRIWMGNWIIKGHQNIEDVFEVTGPACGTVGCIAGNAVVLAGGSLAGDVQSRALNLLGGDDYDLQEYLDRLFDFIYVDAEYGTEEYARTVAERIAGFQAEHKSALQKVRL